MIRNLLRKIYYIKSFLRFKSFGRNLMLGPGGLIARPNEVTIGNNVYIARNFFISARNLQIGNNVMIGPNLVIECDNHSFNKVGYSMFEYRHERIGSFVTIEDDVWIGANTTILANTCISEGVIIGAGSVINRTIPPYTLAVGVPCKPIKTRFSKEELQEHLIKIKSKYQLEEILSEWRKYKLIEL
ncbi:MAG: DapH/DapD/GlmU-related protein [Bacteroidales bacterium]